LPRFHICEDWLHNGVVDSGLEEKVADGQRGKNATAFGNIESVKHVERPGPMQHIGDDRERLGEFKRWSTADQ
jgi:hypothetical protein